MMKKAINVLLVFLVSVLLCACGNTGVSQEEYDKVVAELDEYKEKASETGSERFEDLTKDVDNKSINVIPSNEELHNQIEVIGEYYYIRSEDKPRYFLVLQNNAQETVQIKANAVAMDKDENLLGAADERLNAVIGGQQAVLGFYFDDAGDAVSFEYGYDVEISQNSKSYNDNLEWETSVNGNNLIIMITNTGTETAENIEPYALFFKDGNVFSHEFTSGINIKPGETIPVELKCGDGEFDDFKLYITSFGSKIGGTKTSEEINNEKSEIESSVEEDSIPEDSSLTKSEQNTSTNEQKQKDIPTEKKSDINSSETTMGQKNALKKANSYLNIMAFSYSELVKQLVYVGFTNEEAVYAADNCGADWNEQAAKKAEDYLGIMAFSRDGLIEQLEYVGFTHEQAVYGVEANGY